MTKWRKATIAVILSMLAIIIGYDVAVAVNSPRDTISNVTMTVIYRFPFIGYALSVLLGHFFSFIRTRQRYIKYLVILSSIILVYSIIQYALLITSPIWMLVVMMIIGFFAGMIFWSQRRKEIL